MTILTVKKYPENVLRKICKKLKNVGSSEKNLLSDMVETMHKESGVGLAASQVGVSKSIAVVDLGGEILRLVNPVVVAKKGLASMEEGCLSVPKKCVNVKRAAEITVSYVDESGNSQTRTFDGLPARIVQHEIDHLNGKLIIDYLPWYKKVFK